MISWDKIELYVADSESSSIWAIDMKTLKGSWNVAGGDKNPWNLFAYGDQDDVGLKAKF